MKNIRKHCLKVLFLFLFASHLFQQDVFHGCGMDGESDREYIRTMNRLKNRYNIPLTNNFDNNVSFSSFLSTGDDVGRFRENKAVEIVAWVLEVKWGSKESCNCSHTGQDLQDVHIELVRTKNTSSRIKVVVAEITPRLREVLFDELGISTNNTRLRNTVRKHKVKIKGWLFFDWQHITEAENTDPGDADNIRATAWEIHPITSIKVIQ